MLDTKPCENLATTSFPAEQQTLITFHRIRNFVFSYERKFGSANQFSTNFRFKFRAWQRPSDGLPNSVLFRWLRRAERAQPGTNNAKRYVATPCLSEVNILLYYPLGFLPFFGVQLATVDGETFSRLHVQLISSESRNVWVILSAIHSYRFDAVCELKDKHF